MNRFSFILGSNWQLSLAELDNCLKHSQFKGKIIDYSANIAIVEFDKLHEEEHYVNKLMEFQFILGGCQKIAKIYDFINIRDIYDAFPLRIEKFKLVEKTRDKIISILSKVLDQVFPKVYESMFFAVSIYPNLYDEEYYSEVLVKHFLPFLNKKINKILLKKGADKSLYYKYPQKNIEKGNLNPIFPHVVIKYELLNENRAEIVFGFTEEGVYIGRTFTVDDPNFKKRIDEQRPFSDFKRAISPKLAIIMLNFLKLFEDREDKKILDPFVGNGTIPMFGIIQDFQVFGADIDNKSIKNTRRNVNWLLKELEEPIPLRINERFIVSDVARLADHFELNSLDGICTEPPLGLFYKRVPPYDEVRELIDSDLAPIYDDFFNQAHKVLKSNGRICIVAPVISTVEGKDVRLNIEQLATSNGFKLTPIMDTNRIVNKSNQKLQFKKEKVRSIIDAKKGQIVKRKIYLFERID